MENKKGNLLKRAADPIFLDHWDAFAAQMPRFGYNGRMYVGSWFGFTATIFMTVLMLSYTGARMYTLFARERLSISH
jgi:hypothetical protein